MLVGLVVLVGLLLMVLTVVLLLRRMLLLLLLGVGLLVVVVGRYGEVLLQQNLLAGGGVAVAAAVVMAAATRAGSVAAVCAVGNHLRCASGVCLILQCKITKVVERPGVHYRGRHSPGIFVRWSLPAGSLVSSVDSPFLLDQPFHRKEIELFST